MCCEMSVPRCRIFFTILVGLDTLVMLKVCEVPDSSRCQHIHSFNVDRHGSGHAGKESDVDVFQITMAERLRQIRSKLIHIRATHNKVAKGREGNIEMK